MKKRITSFFLSLALVLSVTGTALAADTNSKGTTVTGLGGAQASFVQGSDDEIAVTYSGGLTAGAEYLVLMLSDSTADPSGAYSETIAPTAGNILYIDQKAAEADGSISFRVYPKSLSTGIILIYGADAGKLAAAIVKAQYVLGDANGDGFVNIYDATTMLQYIVKISPAYETMNVQAADIDGEPGFNIYDVTALLQCIVGLRTIPGLTLS